MYRLIQQIPRFLAEPPQDPRLGLEHGVDAHAQVFSHLRGGLSLPGEAACAVRDTNCGTIALNATNDDLFNVWVKNCRRLNIVSLSW